MADKRDFRGRFASDKGKRRRKPKLIVDHNYANVFLCDGDDCKRKKCPSSLHMTLPQKVNKNGWKVGRRLIELNVLLLHLKSCRKCMLGPVPLMYNNIVGELQKGLGGYLYVVCQNPDCSHINRVPYGKTHHIKNKGMPCFVINTKLGAAMIDSLGGAEKVNNLLAVLNLKAIHPKNLKLMETRAGEAIQEVSRESCKNAAKEAFEKEMSDIARQETEQAHEQMVGEIDDLGVCPLPGESPSLQLRLQARPVIECETDSDVEKDSVQSEVNDPVPGPQNESSVMTSTPQNVLQSLLHTERISRLSAIRFAKQSPKLKSRKRLEKKFPCRTRTGMSSSCDTAWQKKGFDSLTSHTFFMTTNKAGRRKKVIKTIVGHRHCGKCKWWKRNRQGQKVRTHYCVKNHTGSARSMEAASGLKGVRELFNEGTPIEYLEGDGDNTLIARLKSDLNISLKKRFDKNHVVKNVTGTLYKMKSALKLSDNVISHIKKCLSYAFSKNQGDKIGMEENIRALIPHQFADHTLCHGRFCGYKRRPSEKYVHRSLPYMTPLHDSNLRTKLQAVFDTVTANAHSYIDLGSSQQCESANRRVSLRAPKSHYYGDTKSLDYRVEATAACINEGRHYLSQGFVKLGLSPGEYTIQHSERQLKRRRELTDRALLPSSKRRRLELKKERAVIQGASEAMEGDTYQSGIGHMEAIDIERIPDAIARGNFKPVVIDGEPTIITFDLETTGLIVHRVMPDITQIAASDQSGKTFNVYVNPIQPINPEATTVTGISFVNGEMKVRGQIVQSVHVKDAVSQFLLWLEQFKNVVLCAHNGRRFDFLILVELLEKLHLSEKFSEIVPALLDTMSIFRKQYPKSSLKQEDLVKTHLGITYDAHNAVGDVISLGKLISYMNIDKKELIKNTFSVSAVYNNLQFNNAKAKNIQSLEVLIYSGVCKRPTAENVAGSGLNLGYLRLIHKRRGEDGLREVFTSLNNEGLPRVTNSKKVLEDFIPKLINYLLK